MSRQNLRHSLKFLNSGSLVDIVDSYMDEETKIIEDEFVEGVGPIPAVSRPCERGLHVASVSFPWWRLIDREVVKNLFRQFGTKC